jgi:hypothetical protein
MKIIHERLADIDNVDKGLLMSTIVTILSFEVRLLSASRTTNVLTLSTELMRKLLHRESPSGSSPPPYRNIRRHTTLQL